MTDAHVLQEFLDEPLGGVIQRFRDLPYAATPTTMHRTVYVPGARRDRVLLTAHADTVTPKGWASMTDAHVLQEFLDEPLGGVIQRFRDLPYAATGRGIGADDRAGCAILWLLKDMGHSLLVTTGEEQGQVGAHELMANEDAAGGVGRHQFVIAFDLGGAKRFKTYDVGTDEFRRYVGGAMGYEHSTESGVTDICVLCKDICGVNLSVGYANEHTRDETISLVAWKETLDKARLWLSKPDLPRFERNGTTTLQAADRA